VPANVPLHPIPLICSYNLHTLGDMQQLLSAFWNEEDGQDMVEYTLLLGFIALTGAAVLTGIRDQTFSIWRAISAGFTAAGIPSAS